MKSLQIMLAWSWLAILPIATSSAYDGMSPDPGSYRQGSSAPRDYDRTSGYGSDYGSGIYGGGGSGAQDYRRTDSASADYGNGERSDWYSSDWYADQVGGRWRGGEGSWAAPSGPSRQDLESDYSDADPGYGWHDYARPSDHAPANEQPQYGRPQYDVPRYRDDRYDNAYPDQWAAPVQRPRYRFRNDPSLENRGLAGGASGYRFRPLTDKELERHRESADVAQFPQPRRDQRRDSGSRGGEAFGYEPDATPGSFYDRYYRSGP